MSAPTIRISADWDDEARVWVATSEDIGLVTEAETLDALLAKMPDMIADLLDGNGSSGGVPVEVTARGRMQMLVDRSAA
jgi:hypothetical protein